MSLRGKAAIIGLAELKSERYSQGATTLGMLADVGMRAILDAALEPGEIDGLIVEGFNEAPFMAASTVAEYMGLHPSFADVVDHGGATSGSMVIRAASAIAAGLCETAVCVTAARKERRQPRPDAPSTPAQSFSYKDRTPQGEFDVPYGASGAVFAYAMILNRYREKYEATPEQLARIAVAERENAQRNPDALFYGHPLTLDEVMASPMVVEPIRRLDMTTTCAGAGALVVTSAARAKTARNPAVAILGAGENHTHRSISWAPGFEETGVRGAADRAFAMAGMTRAQMDLACIYDCFTSTVLISLEDAGFTPKGTGGRFACEHDLSPTGDFPLNTHGGQLGFGQAGIAGGMSLVTEATRQLMGRAEGRQVPGCAFAFVNGNGGEMSAQSALVLGREA
jgi:acetyl-CoA acetyltransferase